MSVYKIISRDYKTGRQLKKKIYESEEKYLKYGLDLAHRWVEHNDIEVYIMLGKYYELMYEISTPRTKEQFKYMQTQRGYSDAWFNYRTKDL